jgi:hypothetical protein
VARERAEDLERDITFGEIVQNVCRRACAVRRSSRTPSHGGVLGDDVTDRARGDRLRERGLAFAQADEQRVGARRGSRCIPVPKRVVRFGMQRYRPGAAGF